MSNVPGVLSFAELDGLAFAAERGRALPANALYEPAGLGPFVEFSQLADAGLLPSATQAPWLSLGGFAALSEALQRQHMRWISPSGGLWGLLRAAREYSANEWTSFAIAAKRAAKQGGAPDQLAAQLVAALGELYNNIHEHSFAPATGFVAFRSGKGFFEFAAADRGVGLLKSLRINPKFEHIASHDEALRVALSPGKSRFDELGRGMGFSRLFIGLANRNCSLRFRTGDHALTYEGRLPSLDGAHAAQKSALEGFLAMIRCDHGRGA